MPVIRTKNKGVWDRTTTRTPIDDTLAKKGYAADAAAVGEALAGLADIPEIPEMDWVATKKVEGGDIVYIPEQKLTSGVWQNLQMSLQPGFFYDVTINGEVYTCEASENGRGAILGNNTSLTLNDYPFCIMWAGGTAVSGMFFKDSSISYPVTLKVTDHADYVYDKMPEGYLPDSVVKSVNGAKPDADGNVEVEVGGEYLVPMAVPASPAVGELWYDPDAEAPGGITEETDPTVQGWAKTSIPAAVGQYFKVSAVDENGNVTAVEAVDAPSGGGAAASRIIEIADGVDVSAVSSFKYSQDADGNPLTGNKFRFFLFAPNVAAAKWLDVAVNGTNVLRIYYYQNTRFTLDIVIHPAYVETTLYMSPIGGSGSYVGDNAADFGVQRFLAKMNADITGTEKTIEAKYNYGINDPTWGEGATLYAYGEV